MAGKRKPLFRVVDPSEWNGQNYWVHSTKLGMRFGPYDTRAAAQIICDAKNEATDPANFRLTK